MLNFLFLLIVLFLEAVSFRCFFSCLIILSFYQYKMTLCFSCRLFKIIVFLWFTFAWYFYLLFFVLSLFCFKHVSCSNILLDLKYTFGEFLIGELNPFIHIVITIMFGFLSFYVYLMNFDTWFFLSCFLFKKANVILLFAITYVLFCF